MLTEIRYRNFKRYKDVKLDLSKPITVLVGPNSSGKSSLLKGLLAFKQTYDDPSDHAGFMAEGEYVDIGNFEEYVRDHDTKLSTTFTFSVAIPFRAAFRGLTSKRRFVSAKISLSHEEDPQTKHGRLNEYCVTFEDENSECEFIKYTRMQKSEEFYKIDMSYGLFRIVLERRFREETDDARVKQIYEQICQKLARGDIQAARDNQQGMIARVLRGSYDIAFDSVFMAERNWVQPIHAELYNDMTKNIYALASLRAKPARSVKRTDEKGNVGSAGQNTGSVYYSLRQRSAKSSKRNSRLRESVDRLHAWFQRLKLGEVIEINSWRDLIDMRTSPKSSNRGSDSVVDVGVGFSQAAPILVQLAAMQDNSILITEQPELHLYPWAQTRMGEIFCEESLRGNKRLFIETHSEHLIQGIQLYLSRSRDVEKALKPDDVQILYVDEDADIIRIQLDEYGEFVSPWPEGFFDQTLSVYREITANKVK